MVSFLSFPLESHASVSSLHVIKNMNCAFNGRCFCVFASLGMYLNDVTNWISYSFLRKRIGYSQLSKGAVQSWAQFLWIENGLGEYYMKIIKMLLFINQQIAVSWSILRSRPKQHTHSITQLQLQVTRIITHLATFYRPRVNGKPVALNQLPPAIKFPGV